MSSELFLIRELITNSQKNEAHPLKNRWSEHIIRFERDPFLNE